MALSNDELAELRRAWSSTNGTVNYTKPLANAALQEIEDAFNEMKAGLRTRVNTATGFNFSNSQINQAFRLYLQQRFNRGG